MDAVSDIKARLSIEDVISEYVRLKRAGKNFKGLSPFSSEKTPSFVVSPEKQIWHDFSSGRGGDIFTFIQEVEGVDFKAALELLARKVGIELADYKKDGDSRGQINKEQLYKILDQAAKFYQRHLKTNNQVLEYVIKQRRFAKQTVLDFQLGYSPTSGRALVDFLLGKGFSEAELKLCGLVSSNRGLNDMFRGRLMIPLHDQFGKVIGFTARILGDAAGPKYINTPSTPLYDKSRHIYGLHLAKQSIRSYDYSVIVEGNLDVIASHQAGQNQIVATAGTALTEYQMKALSRLSQNVRLSFDQDDAGLAAAERAIPIASKAGVNLSIITVSEGKDPDELIKIDPQLWIRAIADADYAVDWLINRYKDKLDITTAQGKRQFSDITVNLIKSLEDPVEQDHYLNLVAEIAGVDPAAVRQKLSLGAPPLDQKLKQINRPDNLSNQNVQNQITKIDKLFSLSLSLPEVRQFLNLLTPQMLIKPDQAGFLEFIKQNPAYVHSSGGQELQEKNDYVKMLVLQFEELYASVDATELHYEAQRLRAEIIKYFVEQQKTKLFALSHQSQDDGGQAKILASVRDLDKLLSQTKTID